MNETVRFLVADEILTLSQLAEQSDESEDAQGGSHGTPAFRR